MFRKFVGTGNPVRRCPHCDITMSESAMLEHVRNCYRVTSTVTYDGYHAQYEGALSQVDNGIQQFNQPVYQSSLKSNNQSVLMNKVHNNNRFRGAYQQNYPTAFGPMNKGQNINCSTANGYKQNNTNKIDHPVTIPKVYQSVDTDRQNKMYQFIGLNNIPNNHQPVNEHEEAID